MKFIAIGDSCTDEFIYGECDRLSPEVPVPVLQPNKTIRSGGMVKNLARNVKALGVECDVLCNENKMVKTRYVHEKTNHMLLRVETVSQPTKKFNILDIPFTEVDAILISLDGRDGKSFLTSDDVANICNLHRNVFVDSKSKIQCPLPNNLKFLKINDRELEMNNWLKDALQSPIPNISQKKVIVTRGKEGCSYNGKLYPCKQPRETRDLSGAGDTFLAALAVACVDKEYSIDDAIDFANDCASLVVSKKGVSTV